MKHNLSHNVNPWQLLLSSSGRGKDKVRRVRNRTFSRLPQFSHFKPFPAHIRTISRFSHYSAQFGASRTILHNSKYKKLIIYRKTGVSLDNWVEFRQKLG